MGFIVCSVEPEGAGMVVVRRLRALELARRDGAFARILGDIPKAEDGTWSLSADELLRLADPAADASSAIFFDLTPRVPDRIDLYVLLDVSGRTEALGTDLLFHFKIACLRRGAQTFSSGAGALRIPGWAGAVDTYEHLRIEGGTAGGDWLWGASQQAVSATKISGIKRE